MSWMSARPRESRAQLREFPLIYLVFPASDCWPHCAGSCDFLPQIRRRKHWNWLRAQVGLRLFVLGLFKKFVIANRLALYVILFLPIPMPTVFDGDLAGRFSPIRCKSMAIFPATPTWPLGVAHLLGFRLAGISTCHTWQPNVSEFWRRWHISLSSWLRYYYVHSAWRQSRRPLVHLPQPAAHHDASAVPGMRQLDLCGLGSAAWLTADWPSPVSTGN